MEIAVNHHQPLFGGPMQHHLLPGAVIYPGKGSAWQPVVTTLPAAMTEVPKESIIANTDFTITSGLAKRRLSSKKRKKMEANRLSGCDSTLSDGSRSPSDSAYGSCPSVSLNTPPGHERTINPGQYSHLKPTPTSSTLSHSTTLSHTSSSSFHPPTQPPHTSHTSQSRDCPSHTTMPSLVQNQYSNPAMLSQLQQELNYRFLSTGGKPAPPSTEMSTPEQEGSNAKRPAVLKWCNAHISVAKMIQQHQLEAARIQQAQAPPQSLPQALPTSINYTPQTEAAAISAQQQQLALLQMYGVHPTMSTAGGVQPGYMAVPYSTMHEVPLIQFAPVVSQVSAAAPSNVSLLKSGETVLSLPAGQVAIAPSGTAPVQQFNPTQMAVGNTGGLLVQGGGSWMAPVPMVGGNCVVNPLQAGIWAAPWVK